MLNFFRILFHKLRLSKPWRYKAPFLISVPYFFLVVGGFEPMEGLKGIGWSVMTILGIAGFGYWANDFSDREEDKKAGKPNALEGMPLWQAFALLGGLLVAAILPWIMYFPITPITLSLLGAEFGLFLLYSLPPFRLKERGILGAIADAGYAHTLPALLAAVTFYTLAPRHWQGIGIFLVSIGLFQCFLGLRNILLHQIGDHDNDLSSGARTWVIGMGVERAWMLVKWVFVPMECLSFGAFLWVISGVGMPYPSIPMLLLSYPIFLAIALFQIWIWYKRPFPTQFQSFLNLFLDEFYVEWLPIFILSALLWKDWLFAPVAIIHFVLFKNGPKRLLIELFRDRILPRISH